MKMKTIWFIVILIVVVTIFINLNFNNEKEEFKPLEMNVGDIFEGIEYKNTMYVANYLIGDVTGDNENDMIILIGEKEDINNPFYKNVDVIIYDTANKKFLNAGLKKFEGESPKIHLSDLTSDDLNDIIITLENKNKEKNLRVVTITNNTLKEIFSSKENRGINFTGEVIDGLKAYVRCNKLKKELYMDLVDKKEEFIRNKQIDESGKVIVENKKINTSGFTTVEIVELNENKGFQTTQIITAFENKEILDEITVIWKYEDGKWQVKEARGIKLGNLIY